MNNDIYLYITLAYMAMITMLLLLYASTGAVLYFIVMIASIGLYLLLVYIFIIRNLNE